MMRELKKQWSMRWDEVLLVLGIEAGAFLFGEILIVIAVNIVGADTVFEMGTLLALMVPLFLMLFLGVTVLIVCFNTGISMGDTRKRLVPMTFAMSYLEYLMMVGIAYLLHHLELWILRVFYPEMENEMNMAVIFHWKYILPVCLVLVAVQAIFGTLVLKYGKSAFWVLWAIYMVVVIGLPRAVNHGPAAKLFTKVTEAGVLAGMTAVSAVLIMVSCFMLRKQQVQA